MNNLVSGVVDQSNQIPYDSWSLPVQILEKHIFRNVFFVLNIDGYRWKDVTRNFLRCLPRGRRGVRASNQQVGVAAVEKILHEDMQLLQLVRRDFATAAATAADGGVERERRPTMAEYLFATVFATVWQVNMFQSIYMYCK